MSEVKFNVVEAVVHVNAEVLSSYKSKSYRTDIILRKTSGEVLNAKCKCVAGQSGKCKHMAGVLFGLLYFQRTMEDAPESCTSKEKWHEPSRKAKEVTKHLKIGKQDLTQARGYNTFFMLSSAMKFKLLTNAKIAKNQRKFSC